MAQRILGLDLGATSVKAVLLESTFRGFALLDAGSAPLGPAEGGRSSLERQAAAARELRAQADTAALALVPPPVTPRVWRARYAAPAQPASTSASPVATSGPPRDMEEKSSDPVPP